MIRGVPERLRCAADCSCALSCADAFICTFLEPRYIRLCWRDSRIGAFFAGGADCFSAWLDDVSACVRSRPAAPTDIRATGAAWAQHAEIASLVRTFVLSQSVDILLL